jgi:predicted DNA-binding transcriptional regulator AlpA
MNAGEIRLSLENPMKILRFWDLQAAGIVPNRTALHRWTQGCGFPQPTELGPNSVGWFEEDVLLWLHVRTLTPPEFDELCLIREIGADDLATLRERRKPRVNELERWLQIREMSSSKWQQLEKARPRPKAAHEEGKWRCRGNRAGRLSEVA